MRKIFFIIIILFQISVSAQEKDFDLPKANQEFLQKKYVDAEANYRISNSNNTKRAAASYNLGNAIYKQNQASEAKYAYAKAIEKAKGKLQKHSAFHNIGNVFMKEKAYDKAVEAYKNALRNNPSDEETRYNYALAKKMLKENPPKKDDKKDDKKDKDKEKDKKEDENKKDEQPKPNPKKPEPKPEAQNQPNPNERIQNLLDAVNNEEKKVQEKVNAQKTKGAPIETDKDW